VSKQIGTDKPEAESLAHMRKFRCGECDACKSKTLSPAEGADKPCLARWHAYENHELGNPNAGHLKFLAVGPGCTFKTAPKPRLPDTNTDINWRYQHVGVVDLATGEIREETCPT